MNGIRLAALIVAAISLLHVDLGEAVAQPTQEQIDRMGAGRQGRPDRASRSSRSRDTTAEQDRGSRTSGRSSSSRTSNGRRSRSSRSNSNNAIKTNPLFQLFDQDGDGELSLEEIDAASRLLYSLDANEDDAITSDEVEDMVADSGEADEEDDAPSSRSSRSRSSNSRSRSSNNGQPREQPASGGDPENQGRSGRGSSRGSARNSAPAGRSGGRGFGALGATGMGGTPAASAPGGGGNADDDEFGSYDKDGDGVLKRGEMPRSLRTKFSKMDTNGDKEIDEDEYWDYIDNN